MAHAAPAPGGQVPAIGYRPPDVFSERTHAMARWLLPAVLGLIYGYWAAANVRYGGPITGMNVLFGLVTGFVFFAVFRALETFAARMRREVHAFLWAAFTGIAVGFLYSLSNHGHSILGSAGLGLAFAVPTFVVMFYRYYTREDAAGNRIR
ncbi:hypothetical protein SAMN05216532_4414 [Streptomyces sp. 2231.1]|uniref:hypothetical protein n=1 Tax=Streptomyces sp. 2231.1 TaxID=1855347 RepID=UPI00089C965E|nr:hypothetical protein [Streptomyces sp. 2231.1]SED39308.1 hypothetical protein SAMN05216532_4414 [Streptomyces sp. 2231.1]